MNTLYRKFDELNKYQLKNILKTTPNKDFTNLDILQFENIIKDDDISLGSSKIKSLKDQYLNLNEELKSNLMSKINSYSVDVKKRLDSDITSIQENHIKSSLCLPVICGVFAGCDHTYVLFFLGIPVQILIFTLINRRHDQYIYNVINFETKYSKILDILDHDKHHEKKIYEYEHLLTDHYKSRLGKMLSIIYCFISFIVLNISFIVIENKREKQALRFEIEQRKQEEINNEKYRKAHQERIDKSITTKLYHQTAPSNVSNILKNGLKPGHSGLAGAGIYFATNPLDTNHKARSLGTILRCDVKLGNIKRHRKGERWNDLSLFKTKNDSVLIDHTNGNEYVVYDPKQVIKCNVHRKH